MTMLEERERDDYGMDFGAGTAEDQIIYNSVMQWTWKCAIHLSRRNTLIYVRIGLETIEV